MLAQNSIRKRGNAEHLREWMRCRKNAYSFDYTAVEAYQFRKEFYNRRLQEYGTYEEIFASVLKEADNQIFSLCLGMTPHIYTECKWGVNVAKNEHPYIFGKDLYSILKIYNRMTKTDYIKAKLDLYKLLLTAFLVGMVSTVVVVLQTAWSYFFPSMIAITFFGVGFVYVGVQYIKDMIKLKELSFND